ncbi:arrestin domain-containing protein 2-like [Glandiceps talaboti]
MPPIKTFRIALDDNRDVFSAGDVVAGRVIVELSQSFPCKGMQARFVGLVRVNWSEQYEGRTAHFNAKEVYFDEVITILENDPKKRAAGWNLPSGVHRFPFRMRLPDKQFPASFEGKYGFVRYSIKCTMDLSSGKQLFSKRAFTVTGQNADPNKIPNAKAPLYCKAMKPRGCLYCFPRPLTMSVTVKRKGFVPGNVVAVTVKLENSNKQVQRIEAVLLQDAKFTAFGIRSGKATNLKRSIDIVASSSSDGYDLRSHPVWQTRILVPPLPATGLMGCDFIDLQYYVKVEGVLPGDRTMNLICEVPVFIGTRPLRNLTNIPKIDISPLAKFPSEESLHDEIQMPPRYKVYSRSTSIVEETDDENTYGELDFVPKYAYYSSDEEL